MTVVKNYLALLALVAAVAAPMAVPAFAAEPEKGAPAEKQPAEAKATAEPQKEAQGEKQAPANLPVLARVNGADIKKEDVERGARALLMQNRMDPAIVDPEIKKKAEEAALTQLISAEVLYQEGLKLEIKDLDKQVQERLAKSKERFPSPEDFVNALKANNLSEKDLEELTRKDIIVNNVVNKNVAEKIKIGDDKVKKFYDENVDRFKKPESVKASHILVPADEKATGEDKKKAKEKAEALLKSIKDGADFAEVAKKESSCPSAANGGDLGEFGRGQMVPPFEEAAFGLKPGELSGVVETQFGYHIIKLGEKNKESIVPFDEVKERIHDYLKTTELQGAVTSYIEEAKKKMSIEILTADAGKAAEPAKEEKIEAPAKEEKKG